MPKIHDLSGQVFGRLLAVELVPDARPVRWQCLCECGNTLEVLSASLKRGKTSSCGCLRVDGPNKTKPPLAIMEDRAGRVFGRLTALRRDPDDGRKWVFRCECGNEKSINIYQVEYGNVVSCGCFRSERMTAANIATTGMRREPGRRASKDDLLGRRYGRLLVVAWTGVDEAHCSLFECACDCGATVTVRRHGLTSGNTKSCGCLKMEVLRAQIDHGMAHTNEYRRWESIKQRTGNPNNPSYANYGARGIDMEPEWRESFTVFYAEVGSPPGPGYSLDRIDNDRGYVRGNVRWATRTEQQNNRRKVADREVAIAELRAALAAVDPDNPLLLPSG